MTEHRYPKEGLIADLLRAATGLTVSIAPFFMVELGPVVRILLGFFVILFAVYGFKSWHHRQITVRLSDDAILIDGLFGKSLAWNSLDMLKLGYYSVNRDRKGGWLQLALRGAGVRLKLESNLDGFSEIVDRAVRAAHEKDLELPHTTLENLQSMGREATPRPVPEEHL